jgi:hypothetical protein
MEKFDCNQGLAEDLPHCNAKIAALHRYWRTIRPATAPLPGRQHFDPAAVPSLLPCMRLYDVHRDPWRFRYRLVGTELVRILGRDFTGTWFGDGRPEAFASKSYRDLVFVASGQGIAYHRGYPLYASEDKDHLAAERILLPFARNGSDVDMILGFTVQHAGTIARRVA